MRNRRGGKRGKMTLNKETLKRLTHALDEKALGAVAAGVEGTIKPPETRCGYTIQTDG